MHSHDLDGVKLAGHKIYGTVEKNRQNCGRITLTRSPWLLQVVGHALLPMASFCLCPEILIHSAQNYEH